MDTGEDEGSIADLGGERQGIGGSDRKSATSSSSSLTVVELLTMREGGSGSRLPSQYEL